MKFIKKNFYIIVLLTFLVVMPILSFAQATPGGNPISTPGGNAGCDPSKKICNPIKTDTLNGFIRAILEGVFKIGLPILALAFVFVGFLFVQARGNSEELTKAKDALLYTLIGAAVILGSWAIAQLITETVTALKP